MLNHVYRGRLLKLKVNLLNLDMAAAFEKVPRHKAAHCPPFYSCSLRLRFYRISGKSWGPTLERMLPLYKTMVSPVFATGCAAWFLYSIAGRDIK